MDNKDYAHLLGLTPVVIEGRELGSSYKVAVRTATGYVAIRRLSKYYYRVRAERFDKQPLVSANDAASIAEITAAGFNIVDDGTRVSGSSRNLGQINNMVGMLTSILVEVENTFTSMPEGNDKTMLEADAKIDAANVNKTIAKNTNAEAEEEIVLTGKPFKGLN